MNLGAGNVVGDILDEFGNVLAYYDAQNLVYDKELNPLMDSNGIQMRYNISTGYITQSDTPANKPNYTILLLIVGALFLMKD